MLLFLTYLKSENICTKRYFTAEKNAESIFFLTCRSAKHVAIWYQGVKGINGMSERGSADEKS